MIDSAGLKGETNRHMSFRSKCADSIFVTQSRYPTIERAIHNVCKSINSDRFPLGITRQFPSPRKRAGLKREPHSSFNIRRRLRAWSRKLVPNVFNRRIPFRPWLSLCRYSYRVWLFCTEYQCNMHLLHITFLSKLSVYLIQSFSCQWDAIFLILAEYQFRNPSFDTQLPVFWKL